MKKAKNVDREAAPGPVELASTIAGARGEADRLSRESVMIERGKRLVAAALEAALARLGGGLLAEGLGQVDEEQGARVVAARIMRELARG